MSDYEIDLFLTSILGGIIGAGFMLFAVYHHFKTLYRRYREVYESMSNVVSTKKLECDIADLKLQMKALHAEFYYQVDGEK